MYSVTSAESTQRRTAHFTAPARGVSCTGEPDERKNTTQPHSATGTRRPADSVASRGVRLCRFAVALAAPHRSRLSGGPASVAGKRHPRPQAACLSARVRERQQPARNRVAPLRRAFPGHHGHHLFVEHMRSERRVSGSHACSVANAWVVKQPVATREEAFHGARARRGSTEASWPGKAFFGLGQSAAHARTEAANRRAAPETERRRGRGMLRGCASAQGRCGQRLWQAASRAQTTRRCAAHAASSRRACTHLPTASCAAWRSFKAEPQRRRGGTKDVACFTTSVFSSSGHGRPG
jgi:hypothetical protein